MKTNISISACALTLLLSMAARAEVSTVQKPFMDDATVLAVFDAANTADISTARIGIRKARDAAVRELAVMVARDHEDVQRAGRELARKLGILPTPPDRDQTWRGLADAVEQLQQLTGSDFDRAYLSYEVGFHRAVITTVRERLLPSVKSAEVHDFIASLVPAFEHHLSQTEAVARKLGIDIVAAANSESAAPNGCMLRREAMR